MSNSHKNGSSDPGPVPPPRTWCKHCNTAFPLCVPVVGQPGVEFPSLLGALGQHLVTKHGKLPEIAEGGNGQIAAAFQTSIIFLMRNFQSTDERFLQWADRQRHELFNLVMVARVSDEKIDAKVQEFFELTKGNPRPEQVSALVKSMRDAIEERNLYPEPALSRA